MTAAAREVKPPLPAAAIYRRAPKQPTIAPAS